MSVILESEPGVCQTKCRFCILSKRDVFLLMEQQNIEVDVVTRLGNRAWASVLGARGPCLPAVSDGSRTTLSFHLRHNTFSSISPHAALIQLGLTHCISAAVYRPRRAQLSFRSPEPPKPHSRKFSTTSPYGSKCTAPIARLLSTQTTSRTHADDYCRYSNHHRSHAPTRKHTFLTAHHNPAALCLAPVRSILIKAACNRSERRESCV